MPNSNNSSGFAMQMHFTLECGLKSMKCIDVLVTVHLLSSYRSTNLISVIDAQCPLSNILSICPTIWDMLTCMHAVL